MSPYRASSSVGDGLGERDIAFEGRVEKKLKTAIDQNKVFISPKGKDSTTLYTVL